LPAIIPVRSKPNYLSKERNSHNNKLLKVLWL